MARAVSDRLSLNVYRRLARLEHAIHELQEAQETMATQTDIDAITQNPKDSEGRIRAEIDALKAQAPHLDFTGLEAEVGQIAGIAPADTPAPTTPDPGVPGPQPPVDPNGPPA
jgi:hypothetical protein